MAVRSGSRLELERAAGPRAVGKTTYAALLYRLLLLIDETPYESELCRWLEAMGENAHETLPASTPELPPVLVKAVATLARAHRRSGAVGGRISKTPYEGLLPRVLLAMDKASYEAQPPDMSPLRYKSRLPQPLSYQPRPPSLEFHSSLPLRSSNPRSPLLPPVPEGSFYAERPKPVWFKPKPYVERPEPAVDKFEPCEPKTPHWHEEKISAQQPSGDTSPPARK